MLPIVEYRALSEQIEALSPLRNSIAQRNLEEAKRRRREFISQSTLEEQAELVRALLADPELE